MLFQGLLFLCLVSAGLGFTTLSPLRSPRCRISMSSEMNFDNFDSIQNLWERSQILLADTSIGEEDVLAVTGQASDLPNPIYAVGLAAILFIGVGALQFTLGDLTKEEGQARVRDFLATKKDTERKRGYFD